MKKVFLAAITAVSIFTACESPEATDSSSGKSDGISFSTSITRAIGNQWEVNDSVGVFQMPTGTDFSKAIAKNSPYSTPYGDGSFTSKNPLFYPEEATTTYDFIAYYPYKKNISQNYPVDVSKQTNLSKLDLLYAKTEKQGSNDTRVELKFKHCLSNLIVEVKAGTDVSSLDKLNVTLTGAPTQGTFALESGTLSVTETSVKDIPLKVTVGSDKLSATAEAIVMPYSWKGCTLVFNQPDHGKFTYTFKDGAFLAGKKYKLIATLSKNGTIKGVELEGLDSSIDDWNTEGGDMGSVDDNFDGNGGSVKPPVTDGGDGTAANPYTVAQLLDYKNLSLTKNYYVKAYIVGIANTIRLTTHFGSITEDEYTTFIKGMGTYSKILLSDEPDERTPSKLLMITNGHKTVADAVTYLFPYIGKQVTFVANYTRIGIDNQIKSFCSGVWIGGVETPLKFK